MLILATADGVRGQEVQGPVLLVVAEVARPAGRAGHDAVGVLALRGLVMRDDVPRVLVPDLQDQPAVGPQSPRHPGDRALPRRRTQSWATHPHEEASPAPCPNPRSLG